MLKKLSKLIELRIQYLLTQIELSLKQIDILDYEQKYNLETGEKFNYLTNRHAISEDELLKIAETVCKFVDCTRITNIDEYLFLDSKLERPRYPAMLKHPERFKDIMY